MKQIFITTALVAVLASALNAQFVVSGDQGWSSSVGVIFLKRSDNRDTPLFFDGVSTNNPVPASTSDLGSQLEPGVVASLAKRFQNGIDLEFRGIMSASDDTSWADPAHQSAFNGVSFGDKTLNYGVFGTATNFPLSARRSTGFWSFETNLGKSLSRSFRFFVGARAINVSDKLGLTIAVDPTLYPDVNNNADIDVANRMFGPQIGAEAAIRTIGGAPLDLGFTVKLGTLHNDAKAVSGSHSDFFNVHASGSKVGGNEVRMAEFGGTLAWHVSRSVDLDLNYSYLRLIGVVTSPATLGRSTIKTYVDTQLGRGRVTYQAISVQCIKRY